MGGIIFKLDPVETLNVVGSVELVGYDVQDDTRPVTDEGRGVAPQGDPDGDVYKDLGQVVGTGNIEGLKPAVLRLLVVGGYYVSRFISTQLSEMSVCVVLNLGREVKDGKSGKMKPSETRQTHTYTLFVKGGPTADQ